MKMASRVNPLLLVALVATACTGTDVGNPVVDVDVAIYDESFPPADGATRRGGGDLITLTAGWVAVERVRLRDAADCDGDAEVELVGPFVVDMFAPGAIPELSGIEVPELGYCRFELRWDAFDDGLPTGAPPELAGASIVIEGTRGDGTAFVLRSERGDELRLDAVGGSFDVTDATNALFVAFEGPTLFAGLDLDMAIVGGDGVIAIDDSTNDELLAVFDNNLANASKLFDDDDDDGELDDTERDPDDALAE